MWVWHHCNLATESASNWVPIPGVSLASKLERLKHADLGQRQYVSLQGVEEFTEVNSISTWSRLP